jgi:uncharacterized protein YkwD
MKRNRILSLALAVVVLMSLLPLGSSASATTSQPSPWARGYIEEANMAGLLTVSAARNFQAPLTRLEFSELVVEMVERTLGRQLPIPATNPFVDTNDVQVLKAFAYGRVEGAGGRPGITNGISETRFAPNDFVERQQIATMMIRAIRQLERDTGRTLLVPAAQNLPFHDAHQIADWAFESVLFAYSNLILIGDLLGNVNPEDNITSEECVTVILRSFNQMETALTEGRTIQELFDINMRRLSIGFAYGDSATGVTRNVLLPRTGVAGATISWASSNNSIINADGVVNVANAPQNVTLTATVNLGGQTRTAQFTLTTSSFTGERLLLENALRAIEIIYINEGDSADSVTGRIALPTNVMGIPVTWTSNNPSVVTTTGAVFLPTGNDTRSATLTATINHDGQVRSRTFALTVVNPTQRGGVTLHGVRIDMTPQQVTQALGTVRSTVSASSNESWQFFHTNHNNFIAVGFINNRVAAVYSMHPQAASHLRDNANAIITVAQANATVGVTVTAHVDTAQQYAIMLTDSASVIGSRRTLTSEGQERILLEILNGYRIRNGQPILQWSPRLGTPARAHSNWMMQGNTIGLGTGGNSLVTRAANAGFTTTATGATGFYGGGNVGGGHYDVFGFLQQMVSTNATRNELLSNTATLFGAGFSSTTTGNYRTFFAYMLGNVRHITNVTSPNMSGSPSMIRISGAGAGSRQQITLNLTFFAGISGTALNEPFTVTSSNTNTFRVYSGGTSTTPTLEGVSNGSANLIITGNLSGSAFEIPVNVGVTAASSLTVSVPGLTLTNQTGVAANTNATQNGARRLVMGVGETLIISAATGAGATVSWSRTAGSAANFTQSTGSNNVTVTATNSTGQVTFQARVPTGANTWITHIITVDVVSMTFNPASPRPLVLNAGASIPGFTAVTSGATANIAPQNVAWSTAHANVLVIGINTTNPAAPTISGHSGVTTTTTTQLTGTASWNNATFFGSARHTINVTVQPVGIAVTGITITNVPTNAVVGEPGHQLGVTIAPTNATNLNVNWSTTTPGIVSVSNTGVVTFVSAGSASVTATSVSHPAVFATVTFTVSAAPPPPSVTITGGNTVVGGESLQLNAEVVPLGETVTWLIPGGSAVASVNQDGLVTTSSVDGPIDVTIQAQITVDGNVIARTHTITITPLEPI